MQLESLPGTTPQASSVPASPSRTPHTFHPLILRDGWPISPATNLGRPSPSGSSSTKLFRSPGSRSLGSLPGLESPSLRKAFPELAVEHLEWNIDERSFEQLVGPQHQVRHIARAEERGIMIKQLEHLLDFLKAQLTSFRYRNNARLLGRRDMVTAMVSSEYKLPSIYHVNEKVIKPLTQSSKCSYVEVITLSEKAQVPTWFVSHWWGDLLHGIVSSLRAHAALRHPDSDATIGAYWMFAFASSQKELQEGFGEDPRQSPVYIALKNSRGMILLLTVEGPPAVFQRIWCNFEIALATEELTHLTFDVVAHDSTGAHVLTDGLTSTEAASKTRRHPFAESGGTARVKREAIFPVEVMRKGLSVNLLDAKAAMAKDKHQILNIIAGKSVDSKLDLELPVYDEIDRHLRARFARLSLRPAVLQHPHLDITDNGDFPILRAIRESGLTVLSLDLSSCWKMTDACMRDLAVCLPQAEESILKEVDLNLKGCYQLSSFQVFLRQLTELKSLQKYTLGFEGCSALAHGDFEHFGLQLKERENVKKVDLNFKGCYKMKTSSLTAMTEHLKAAKNIKELKVISPQGDDLAYTEPEPELKRPPKKEAPPAKEYTSVTSRMAGIG